MIWPGHVGRPGRLAALVVHHVHGRPLPFQPDHGAHEVRPVRAVEPGGPHHVAVPGSAGARPARRPAWCARRRCAGPGRRARRRAAGRPRRTRSRWRSAPGGRRSPRTPRRCAPRRGRSRRAPRPRAPRRRPPRSRPRSSRPRRAGAAASAARTAAPSVMSRSRRVRPVTSSPAGSRAATRSRPSIPPGPGDQPAGHGAGPAARAAPGRLALQRLPPAAVVPVPAHGRPQAFAERDLRGVAHAPQQRVVQRVAAVVALAVLDVGDHVPAGAAALEQGLGQLRRWSARRHR